MPSRSTSQALPAVRGPRLPHQRRLPRVDADAVHPAVQLQRRPRSAARRRSGPNSMRSPGCGASAKHEHVLAVVGEVRGPVDRRLAAGAGSRRCAQLAGHDGAVRARWRRPPPPRSRCARWRPRCPRGSSTGSGCGADSQKVTSARAADGGNSVIPIRSRNARWFFSGTRLSRYTIWSAMWATVSTRVTPGSETLWSVHSGARCWM